MKSAISNLPSSISQFPLAYRISVIICTFNRVRYLEGSIGSLAKQTLAQDEFEIILVDNASTDGTRQWAEQAANRVANLVYAHEPTPGANRARNLGWQMAKSGIVVFLDDDAVAAPNWLEKIVEKFQQRDAKLAIIGGKIEPLWEAPPPDWMGPKLWACLSVLDWSPTDMVLGGEHYVVSANMAVRKSALAEVGGFPVNLGRVGTSLLSNDELPLKRSLEAAGYYSLYSPEVVVQHSVPKERMTKEWFRRRYYWQGISNAFMEQTMESNGGGVLSRARAIASNARVSLQMLRSRMRLAFGDQTSDSAFQKELGWRQQWGYVAGRWRVLLGKGS